MTAAVGALVIYAYSSFVSSFGAGPEIVKKFQEKCSCKVTLVDAGDGGTVLNRVKLEGDKTKADLVIGIDQSITWRVEKELGWKQKGKAFDRAPLAFIYNSEKVSDPPKSLEDLLDPHWKNQIAIQDPRLSTAGLNFLLWVIKDRGEEKAWEYFKKLKPQVRVVAPSWDLAYGMFKKNQVKLVLSYWTSPAYHIQEEKTEAFKAAAFSGGHYEQVEMVVVNPQSQHRELAEKFQDYLLDIPAQKALVEKNFMFPESIGVPLTPAFQKLGKAKVLKSLDQKEIEKNLDSWLTKWREIFSS